MDNIDFVLIEERLMIINFVFYYIKFKFVAKQKK